MIGYNQFCTVEQAVALKKFGIVQQSMMYWHQDENGNWNHYYNPITWTTIKGDLFISAFTSQELRVMIPDVLIVDCEHFLLEEKRIYGGGHYISYWQKKDALNNRLFLIENSSNELHVRAYMLLKLLESKRVDIDECNKQLIKFHNSAE